MKKKTIDRFVEKVFVSDSGCWEWLACRNKKGYGQFKFNGSMVYVHRYSYEFHVGPIPDGLQIDHLCRNRGCVNPEHMEPVTPKENTRRGITGEVNGARQRAKTHCPYGHPYSGKNLYVAPDSSRYCMTCRRRNDRKRMPRNRESSGVAVSERLALDDVWISHA